MVRTRLVGLLLLILSCGISVFWGAVIVRTSPGAMVDFANVYYGSRCLLHGCDPYRQSDLLRFNQRQGGERPVDDVLMAPGVTLYVNLPSASSLVAPFAILPWRTAQALWMSLMAAGFTLAAFLLWDAGANHAPGISIFLICLLVANSEAIFIGGNTAGIVTGLCVLAVWCFLHNRYVPAGVLCLAVSLAIKPQDAGFIWLFFLLAGGVYRRRALQTLLVTFVLSLPAILWVTHISPHWMQELHSNLLTISARGGLNDPSPASATYHTLGQVINLQAAISVFWDDPRIYNPVSYLVCGVLLLIWSVTTLRSRLTLTKAWYALAGIAAITMLPTYHRLYDAKLLLLSVPACAMLWTEGGPIKWFALLVNAAGILVNGDIPIAVSMTLIRKLPTPFLAEISGKLLTVLVLRPASLLLLVMGVFYLWVYVRRAPDRAATTGAKGSKAMHIY
jgi:hypothetical protein